MNITIAPFTVDPVGGYKAPPVGYEKENTLKEIIRRLLTGESISTTNTYPIHLAKSWLKRQSYG
jgi:hypothetical protein